MPTHRSKRHINHLHAKKRAAERYGLDLNRQTHKQLVKTVQEGRAEFIRRRSNTRTEWDIPYGAKMVRAVYDSNQKNLVTILPERAWKAEPSLSA